MAPPLQENLGSAIAEAERRNPGSATTTCMKLNTNPFILHIFAVFGQIEVVPGMVHLDPNVVQEFRVLRAHLLRRFLAQAPHVTLTLSGGKRSFEIFRNSQNQFQIIRVWSRPTVSPFFFISCSLRQKLCQILG